MALQSMLRQGIGGKSKLVDSSISARVEMIEARRFMPLHLHPHPLPPSPSSQRGKIRHWFRRTRPPHRGAAHRRRNCRSAAVPRILRLRGNDRSLDNYCTWVASFNPHALNRSARIRRECSPNLSAARIILPLIFELRPRSLQVGHLKRQHPGTARSGHLAAELAPNRSSSPPYLNSITHSRGVLRSSLRNFL